jgi:hypothetical protein
MPALWTRPAHLYVTAAGGGTIPRFEPEVGLFGTTVRLCDSEETRLLKPKNYVFLRGPTIITI